MMTIKLSKRLQLIAEQISKGAFFADIGSDHAYLPCYVCQHDAAATAIAGEVVRGPYERAVETVKAHQLEDRITVRLGDGLDVVLEDEQIIDIIIAGMGGGLIASILENGKEKVIRAKKIIAQPNTNAKKVRETLINLGFTLTEEMIIEENNQFYEILIAENNNETEKGSPYVSEIFEKQLLFGPFLLQQKSATFKKKWQLEYNKLLSTISSMKQSNNPNVQDKIILFKQRLQWIEEVIR